MKNIVDKSHRIADELQHGASQRHAIKLAAAGAYHEGYAQACEDFAKEIRDLARQQDDKTTITVGNCSKCGAELSCTWAYCPDCGRQIVKGETEN